MPDAVYTFARILLPVLFVAEGVGQLANAGNFAHVLQQSMALLKVPLPEQFDVHGISRFVILASLIGVVEVVAGTMIVLGYFTRTAAVVLAVFTACTIAFGHPFWTMEGPLRALNLTQALKNVSIIAGLLMVAAIGGGALFARWPPPCVSWPAKRAPRYGGCVTRGKSGAGESRRYTAEVR